MCSRLVSYSACVSDLSLTEGVEESIIESMKIPPYWVTEKRRGCDGCLWKLRGISYKSMTEARERLEERFRIRSEFAVRHGVSADAVAQHSSRLRALDELRADEYSTLLLEPVLQQVDADNVITRNRYGVQVLNSTSLCFVDVDHFPLSVWESFLGMLGKKTSPEEKLLQVLHSLCAADESLGARLYRTHKGWRVMLMGDGLAPDSPRMREICRALHADHLYESLCSRQQCWRARLTPKPYRVGVPGYPRPVDSESVNSPEAQEWVQRYESACRGKGVCRLVDVVGRKLQSPIIELHDRMTAANVPDAVLA